MAKYAETLTLPADLAAEFQAAWNASVSPMPRDMPIEDYWKARIERCRRLVAAYERMWAELRQIPLLCKVFTDAMHATDEQLRQAERQLRQLRGKG